MQNVEADIEQLESYLDGALEAAELAVLDARLKSDETLSQSLTELKAQRAVRAAVWQSMEPDAAASDRLMWRVRGAMLQQKQQQSPGTIEPRRSWSQWRLARVGSAAAACLVLGFMFGRIGQSHNSPVTPGVSSVPGGIAINDPTPTVRDQVQTVGDTAQHESVVQGNTVSFTDPYGRVYYQKFKTAEDAKQFEHDLHDTHSEPSAPLISGPSRLATEEH